MGSSVLLGLDVGSVRVGVAIARTDVRIPQPLTTLQREPDIWPALTELVRGHEAAALVVGWPRGLEGQSTGQTEATEAFVEELRQHVSLPVYLQDEALTSHKAEAELQRRGKPFGKGDVDALAATYILEDYLQAHPGQPHEVGTHV